MFITQNMPKSKSMKDKTLLDEFVERSVPPELLINYQRPNIQFIRQAKQLSKRTNEIVEIFENFRDNLKIKDIRSASIRTGNGFFINTANFNIESFHRDNIVEVIDFDPVRNNMMLIGNEPPAPDAALHWFIYRGRQDINGIINIENSTFSKQLSATGVPKVETNAPILDLETAFQILKTVRSSTITLLDKSNILVLDRTLKDAYDSFVTNLKGQKVDKKKIK